MFFSFKCLIIVENFHTKIEHNNKLLFNLLPIFVTKVKNLHSNFKLFPDKHLSSNMQLMQYFIKFTRTQN